MQKRFMILMGVAGTLVTDPHSEAPHRFVGMEPIAPDKWEGTKHARKYAPVVQARVYHPDLVLAVKQGELKQFGGFVMADDESDAIRRCKDESVTKFFEKRANDEQAAVEAAKASAEKREAEAAKVAKAEAEHQE